METAPRILRLVAECSRSRARAGELRLPHGPVATPVFMPVGTQATMKGITAEQLDALGCRICLGNTYHLGLRPVGAVPVRVLAELGEPWAAPRCGCASKRQPASACERPGGPGLVLLGWREQRGPPLASLSPHVSASVTPRPYWTLRPLTPQPRARS